MGAEDVESVHNVDQRSRGIFAILLDSSSRFRHDDEVVVLALVANLGNGSFAASHFEMCACGKM